MEPLWAGVVEQKNGGTRAQSQLAHECPSARQNQSPFGSSSGEVFNHQQPSSKRLCVRACNLVILPPINQKATSDNSKINPLGERIEKSRFSASALAMSNRLEHVLSPCTRSTHQRGKPARFDVSLNILQQLFLSAPIWDDIIHILPSEDCCVGNR